MTANENKRKMDGWNIFNEMFVHKAESGEYKKDGPAPQDCVWMRMGFEADQSGLNGAAKINEKHPVVFRKALKYASMASGKLEIRECRVEEINRKSDALYQLIKHLLNSGVRVDAVGFQGHLNVNRSYDWESVKKNIRRFKDLGLEVYITELDVSMGMGWKKGDPFPKGYEKLQAERFYGMVKAAREAGVLDGVQVGDPLTRLTSSRRPAEVHDDVYFFAGEGTITIVKVAAGRIVQLAMALRRQGVERNLRGRGGDQGALQDVAQLARVAGEGITLERGQGVGRKRTRGAAVGLAEAGES